MQSKTTRSDQNGYYSESITRYFDIDLQLTPDEKLSDLMQFLEGCSREFSILFKRGCDGDSTCHKYLDMQHIANMSARTIEWRLIHRNEEREQQRKQAQNFALIADIPACNDSTVIRSLKDAIANSPAGRTQGVELFDIADVKDTSGIHRMGARECSADGAFNFGERRFTYFVKWFGDSKQRLLVSF